MLYGEVGNFCAATTSIHRYTESVAMHLALGQRRYRMRRTGSHTERGLHLRSTPRNSNSGGARGGRTRTNTSRGSIDPLIYSYTSRDDSCSFVFLLPGSRAVSLMEPFPGMSEVLFTIGRADRPTSIPQRRCLRSSVAVAAIRPYG